MPMNNSATGRATMLFGVLPCAGLYAEFRVG